ncbi:hypothetical protein B0H14DRAFT_3123809 [Mycena olivaceomarginata]|nr:hypothetical protein B0H14DRAFT_3123809 [Mycena olivaceomarginata]
MHVSRLFPHTSISLFYFRAHILYPTSVAPSFSALTQTDTNPPFFAGQRLRHADDHAQLGAHLRPRAGTAICAPASLIKLERGLCRECQRYESRLGLQHTPERKPEHEWTRPTPAGGVVSPTSPSPANAIGGMIGAGSGSKSGGGSRSRGREPRSTRRSTYSIFVGTWRPRRRIAIWWRSFRNPVLGLRNDRAPKFIRPFGSCKSAKIMLDLVTGVSRGYGFVRFTDEADQQRTLIEMQGLYCLSRPMRISPATAKFKPPPPNLAQLASPPPASFASSLVSPTSSAPTAYTSVSSSVSSIPSSVSGEQGQQAPQQQQQASQAQSEGCTPGGSQDYLASAPSAGQEYFAHCNSPSNNYSSNPGKAKAKARRTQRRRSGSTIAHARAIPGNLIGPNGEQLPSTDPYNTTVFVGGLSPLVGEETLRTFFVPFDEIHYVKVPMGKHCGFVQFVRKADAERAIEKMQGFPVGGSRIRLNKAAQAAAQAAQAAALQAASASTPPPPSVTAPPAAANGSVNGVTPVMFNGMMQGQAIMFLQKFGVPGFTAFPAPTPVPNAYTTPSSVNGRSYAPSAPASGGNYAPTPSARNCVPTPNANSNGADAHRNSFHSSSPSNSNVSKTYLGATSASMHTTAPQTQFTDENFNVRAASRRSLPIRKQQGIGLYAAAEIRETRRDSYSAAPHAVGRPPLEQGVRARVLPRAARAADANEWEWRGEDGDGDGGRVADARVWGRINHYQAHKHHAPQTQTQTQPISRPNSGSARGGAGANLEEFDSMHDLNGTLASLDLDREYDLGHGDRPWCDLIWLDVVQSGSMCQARLDLAARRFHWA